MSTSVEDFLLRHADDTVAAIETHEDDDLRQYGILGMKWGRRRPRGANGRVVDGPAVRAPKDKPKKKPESTRPSHSAHIMTDEELRARLNRLQLEKQYMDLIKAPPRQRKPVEKFVVDVLSNSGKSVATKYTTKILEEAVGAALRKSKNPLLNAAGQVQKKKSEDDKNKK